ncbi:MAG: LysR family transcriptional regulator [Rhodospirillaceae bacterium]|nr:LysR family transcriptional regulator [Rhodospirillaceae bacterium]MYB14860.1 LysR family transcriptional regulator [Rhodospirillaceae bacterium]MYG53366.1 LysR family transcriptional regulator [Rhodospirillaceae bacterium]MYI50247.1 LysR family transcriptional regulator [Rhodospirillaceae bacterium]
MDWDKLRVFLAVAEAGSFTHAGDTLHLSQSAVSRQIGALEESLNAALFNRHARGLVLTEQGELLYRNVREMAGRLNETEALIAESKQKPEGPLVVTAPTGLGSSWLTPRIGEFLKRYPDIDVSLLLADSDLDLGMREADVAIRITEPTQPDLIRRSLMTIHNHVYGSTDYVRRHGMPKTPSDLDNHRLITFTDHPPVPAIVNADWILKAGANGARLRTPALRVNSVYGVYRAVRSGVGLALLPDYLVDGNANLVRVLSETDGPAITAYFVYPETLRKSARVAVFRDFLIHKIAETRF